MDKSIKPTNQDLMDKLGQTFSLWSDLKKYLKETLKDPAEEWNFPGKKYGWSFRMKSKKRNIIYFLPRDGFFMVAFVFGQKAKDMVMESNIDESIKTELQNAKVYAEGRGIRIDFRSKDIFEDIKTLVDIKVEN